ncbi:hypothetical protein JCM8547_005513 [Rhodosporidiobolus lusitaniae]
MQSSRSHLLPSIQRQRTLNNRRWFEDPLRLVWKKARSGEEPVLVDLKEPFADPRVHTEKRAEQVRALLAARPPKHQRRILLDGMEVDVSLSLMSFILNFAALLPVHLVLASYVYLHREYGTHPPRPASFASGFATLLFRPSFFLSSDSHRLLAPPLPYTSDWLETHFGSALALFSYLYRHDFLRSVFAIEPEKMHDWLRRLGVPDYRGPLGIKADEQGVEPAFAYADLIVSMRDNVSFNTTPPLPPPRRSLHTYSAPEAERLFTFLRKK